MKRIRKFLSFILIAAAIVSVSLPQPTGDPVTPPEIISEGY